MIKVTKLFNFQSCKVLHKTLLRFQSVSDTHIRVAIDIIQKCSGRKESSGEHADCVYVTNPDIAKSISASIADEWTGGYLFEANAGPGILSSYLIRHGIKPLRVFEKKKEFLPALKALADDHPDSVDVVKQDLILLPSLEFRKSLKSQEESEHTTFPDHVNDFFGSAFRNIPECPWENGTPFQVFSVIANKKSRKFLRYLLAAIPNRATLFSFGRCDFFLLIDQTEFLSMNAPPKDNFSRYRWSTVLYNVFFDIKCLQKFSPNPKDFLFYGRNSKKIVENEYYLVKLTPKPDLFAPPMTQEKLLDFFYFVRCFLAKRSDLVIKAMEQWIPWCGVRLIKEGMTVFMRFGDLSPNQILQLFILMSECPEYENCNLQSFARRFQNKTRRFSEEDEDFPE